MESLLTVNALLALLALTSLEIVLGIDNIVFVAIVCQKLPPEQRDKARVLGLILAVVTRVMLLFSLSFLMGASEPLFAIWSHPVSIRDLILLAGGGFLIFKSTKEIHHHVAEPHHGAGMTGGSAGTSLRSVVFQILLVDMVFSFDSVITAVGVADQISIMVIAVLLAIGVMLAFSKHIVRFVEEYPTLKMLALSFILLVGVVLVMEGTGKHIQKGYIYFAMGFSLVVEMLNIRRSRKQAAAHLSNSHS